MVRNGLNELEYVCAMRFYAATRNIVEKVQYIL